MIWHSLKMKIEKEVGYEISDNFKKSADNA